MTIVYSQTSYSQTSGRVGGSIHHSTTRRVLATIAIGVSTMEAIGEPRRFKKEI